MTREELVQRRAEVYEEYKRLVALGDYSADTSSIRLSHRTSLDILQHLIDSVKKPKTKHRIVTAKPTDERDAD